MEFSVWIKKMQTAPEEIGADHAMREFVTGLNKYDKLYHFDESAKEIFSLKTNERIFTDEEAAICDSIVSKVYCEEMFILATQLIEENEEKNG